MKAVIHFFISSDLFIGSAAVAMTLSSFFICNWQLDANDIWLFLFIFSSTFVIYNIDLISIKRNDSVNVFQSKKKKWIREHKIFSYLFFTLSVLAINGVFWQFKLSTQVFIIHLSLISLLYYFPLFPFIKKEIALRKIPYAKTFFISYVWASVSVILPLFEKTSHENLNISIIFLFAENFLFFFAISLLFDIRDVKVDKEEGVLTLARTLGINKTKFLSIVLLILSLILTFIHYGFQNIFLAKFLNFIFLIILVSLIKKGLQSQIPLVLVDFAMILQPILIFLFQSRLF